MNKVIGIIVLIISLTTLAHAEDPSDNTLNEVMPKMRVVLARIDIAESDKDRELKMQLLEQIVELRKDMRTACKLQRKLK